MSYWRVGITCLLLVGTMCSVVVSPVSAVEVGNTESAPVTPSPESLETDSQLTSDPKPLATDSLTLTTTLRRTPDRVGEIGATVTIGVPEQFTELQITVPANVTVTETKGFSQTEGDTYEWTKASDTPTVTYQVDANQRVESGQPGADGQYQFVDTESWSLVRIPPQPNVSGRYTGSERPPVVRETELAGAGVVGDAIAFLGDYELRTHTAHGQLFRLVIPEAATLKTEPETIFESLAAASDRLRVGDRDDEVFMIAAPTSEVKWAVRGLQTGDSDLWVRDTEEIDTPANNWIHEYVHTRQDYEAETSFRWFTEGSATYYSALLTLEQQRTGFDRFERFLATGEEEPHTEAILSEPGSWENYANYRKGALVAGEIDRQVRLSTEQEASLATIFRAVNSHDGPVDAETFVGYVQRIAGDQTASEALTAATTAERTRMWDTSEHAAAFDQQPASFDYRLAADRAVTVITENETRRVSGANVTLGVNDTLAVEMTVENVGGTVGDYTLAFRTTDTDQTREGRLAPGEATTHRFEYRFTESGAYPVEVGDRQLTVTVENPEPSSVELPSDSDVMTDSEIPGFGVGPAVIALTLGAGLRRYRQR